jgi:hypothetical protein
MNAAVGLYKPLDIVVEFLALLQNIVWFSAQRLAILTSFLRFSQLLQANARIVS